MEKEKWQTKFLRLCYEQGVTLKEIIDNGFPNKDSTIKYLSGDNPLMMRWDIINTYVKNLENKELVKIKDNNSHYWYMENGTLKDWRYKDNILNETEDEENEI